MCVCAQYLRVVCVLCREMERETEGDREAGVCSVCIMQIDGERDRERSLKIWLCVSRMRFGLKI